MKNETDHKYKKLFFILLCLAIVVVVALKLATLSNWQMQLENKETPSSETNDVAVIIDNEDITTETVLEDKITPTPTVFTSILINEEKNVQPLDVIHDTKTTNKIYNQVLNQLNSEQAIFLVINEQLSILSIYEKCDNEWEIIQSIQNNINCQQDFKSGVFALGTAFGKTNDIVTNYPFLMVKHSIYDDWLNYDYGLDIVTSTAHDMYLHSNNYAYESSLSSISIDDEELKNIISWLNKAANPLILIGDIEDYKNWSSNGLEQPTRLTDNFAYIETVIPSIHIDAKYYTGNNFLGTRVDGYKDNTAILKMDTCEELKEVQEELLAQQYSLIIYDAYRPQKAVDHFVRWTKDLDDTINKEKYYSNIDKNELISKGFIASQSSHSKGNTVDLSILDLKTLEEIDMGSSFDLFDEISHYKSNQITDEQLNNRTILRDIMMKHGFQPYSKEWWHFSYNKDAYKNAPRYNFDVIN